MDYIKLTTIDVCYYDKDAIYIIEYTDKNLELIRELKEEMRIFYDDDQQELRDKYNESLVVLMETFIAKMTKVDCIYEVDIEY